MLPKNNKSSEIFVHIFLSFLCSLLQASKSYISTSRLKNTCITRTERLQFANFGASRKILFFLKLRMEKGSNHFSFVYIYLLFIFVIFCLSMKDIEEFNTSIPADVLQRLWQYLENSLVYINFWQLGFGFFFWFWKNFYIFNCSFSER